MPAAAYRRQSPAHQLDFGLVTLTVDVWVKGDVSPVTGRVDIPAGEQQSIEALIDTLERLGIDLERDENWRATSSGNSARIRRSYAEEARPYAWLLCSKRNTHQRGTS
jgi:hypothetical protein